LHTPSFSGTGSSPRSSMAGVDLAQIRKVHGQSARRRAVRYPPALLFHAFSMGQPGDPPPCPATLSRMPTKKGSEKPARNASEAR
jgi:hypothetical protein